jgi:hypothetical protein
MNPLRHAKRTALALGIALFGSTIIGHTSLAKDKDVIPATALAQPELEQAINWLRKAKENHTAVKDYKCTLVSQEFVNGKLQEPSYIQLKMKTDPFSVHMRWIAPEKSKGTEVVFALGKNNNKMRVKSSLLPNGPGIWVNIDTNDKRVMQHSRHTILETGIGNMIEQSLAQCEKDKKAGNATVKIAEYMCNNKACYRLEIVRQGKDAYCPKSIIFLEKESKLPIRVDNYQANGELLESFSYVNLEFNTGLTAADFNK